MKIYKTQAEIEADIVDGLLKIYDDVKFKVSFKIDASMNVYGNIDAWNIDARDINAWNIDALDINAQNIDARDISFFAVAVAYFSFKCKSITSRRDNGKYFCLDADVEITGKPLTL